MDRQYKEIMVDQVNNNDKLALLFLQKEIY